MYRNLPGSSVHGILQARILELVAIPFSRGSSPPRDGTWVCHFAGRLFTAEPPGKPTPISAPPNKNRAAPFTWYLPCTIYYYLTSHNHLFCGWRFSNSFKLQLVSGLTDSITMAFSSLIRLQSHNTHP